MTLIVGSLDPITLVPTEENLKILINKIIIISIVTDIIISYRKIFKGKALTQTLMRKLILMK